MPTGVEMRTPGTALVLSNNWRALGDETGHQWTFHLSDPKGAWIIGRSHCHDQAVEQTDAARTPRGDILVVGGDDKGRPCALIDPVK